LYPKELLAKTIDFSLLKPQLSADEIISGCDTAREYHFACVFVLPYWVALAAERLSASDVKVGTVIGFPLGAVPTTVKEQEARRAIADGAREIDMVINIGALKSGRENEVLEDIASVVGTAHISGMAEDGKKVLVKAIIETCYLTREEKVMACRSAQRAGADFVKTSTGFGPSGATVEDVRLIRSVVGPEMGVKAAGGIKSLDIVLDLLAAGANRIGTSSAVEIMQEVVKRARTSR